MPPKKKSPPRIDLNSEQREVVNAGEGFWRVLSGPGSGKSTCLIARYCQLIESGVPADQILTLTFTSSAAKSMRERAEAICSVQKMERVSGWMTFHSLALQFCTQERDQFPFKLADHPLCLEPVANKIAGDVGRKYEIDPRQLRPYISLQKRNRIRPRQALQTAEKEGKGEKLALAYKLYDAKLRENGVLDFDSLQLEMVDMLTTPMRGLENPEQFAMMQRWQYQFCMADESQDNSSLEWQLLKRISQRGNLLCVGDAGQCQPAGTKVLVVGSDPKRISKYPRCSTPGPHWFPEDTGRCQCGVHIDDTNSEWATDTKRGQLNAYNTEVNIEDLTKDHKVVSWTKLDQRLYPTKGRSIDIASRMYVGPMLSVTSNGNTTRMTPNHWVWARFSKRAFVAKPYYVYLMYKEGLGFRIGISHVRKAGGCSQLTQRGKQEKADKFWILKFCESKSDALIQEEVLGVTFGISQCVFHADKGRVVRTPYEISEVFRLISLSGGFRCLEKHGLMFEYPLVEWPLCNHQKFRGYVRIRACNLVEKYMELPTCEINGSAVIDSISSALFEGLVYSLDVEKDHTYVADGIPVGNCIYNFRGSSSQMFMEMDKMFPGTRTLYLATNFRSTPQVVDLCRQVGPVPDLAEKFTTPNPDGPPIKVIGYSSASDEADAVTRAVVDNMAVLARCNRNLRPIEDAFSVAGIKYYMQGRSGFWSQPEIRAILAYLQCCIFPSDAAVMGALRAPFHPARYIKKTELAAKVKAKSADINVIQFLHRFPDERVRGFVHFLDGLRRYRDQPPQVALSAVLRDLHATDYYKEEEATPDNSPLENLQELLKTAQRFSSVKEFLDYTRRASAAAKGKKGICLSTVHSAKGLEWDTVYFIALNEGVLPHAKAESVDDERNVYFVGISRAKRVLNLSYAGRPSQFLEPLLAKEVEEVFA